LVKARSARRFRLKADGLLTLEGFPVIVWKENKFFN